MLVTSSHSRKWLDKVCCQAFWRFTSNAGFAVGLNDDHRDRIVASVWLDRGPAFCRGNSTVALDPAYSHEFALKCFPVFRFDSQDDFDMQRVSGNERCT